MAADLIDKAILVGGLEERECVTKHLPIHGFIKNTDFEDPLYYYGADKSQIRKTLPDENHVLSEKLHPALPYIKAEIVWAVRNEMARTVEDFLARRTRALLLDAAASIEIARKVADLMAQKLNRNNTWIENQIESYTRLAKNYLIKR